MTVREFLRKLSGLIASLDEDSKDWLKSPRLRSSWHRFFLSVVVAGAANAVVVVTPLSEYLSQLTEGVFWFRVIMASLLVVVLVCLVALTAAYFSHTIERGHRIRLQSVLFFYMAAVLVFGFIYYFAFLAQPSLFQYDASRIHWFGTIGMRGLKSWSTKLLLLLYSSFRSIGGAFADIHSNSIIVSVINYAQALYSFCLVSLLIAGYVNERTGTHG